MTRHRVAASFGVAFCMAVAFALPGSGAATPSSAQLQSARRLFEAGRYPQAVAEFRRIASGEEASAEAVIAGYYVGLSEERRGNRDAAMVAYRALLSRHGENTEMSGFARQRLRELEAGAPTPSPEVSSGASQAGAQPAAGSAAGGSPAVDRLARTVLSDIMSGDRAVTPAPRRTRASRRAVVSPVAAAPAVWPVASRPGQERTDEGFPADSLGADYPLAAAVGPMPSPSSWAPRYPAFTDAPEYPRLTSISWDRAADGASQGTLAPAAVTSSSSATTSDAGYQQLGDGPARATHVRRSLPTTEVASDVSSPGAARTVAAWASPAVTWEVSVERAELPGARPSRRVPPPASGTAIGGPQGFVWLQGDPEGLPPLVSSRPAMDPIDIATDVPSLVGSDGRSRVHPAPVRPAVPNAATASPTITSSGMNPTLPTAVVPIAVAPAAVVPAAAVAARPEARAAALGSPWDAPAPASPTPPAFVAGIVPTSVQPELRSPLEPSMGRTSSLPAVSSDASSDALDGWELPSPSASSTFLVDPPPSLPPSPDISGSSGNLGDLTLPASLDIQLPAGAQSPSSGSRSDRPLAPIELAPTGVAGRSLPPAGPASPWIEKALSMKRLGHFPEAIEAYRQALLADTGNPVVRNNLADLLVEQGGDLDEAIQLVTEALTMVIADRGPYFSTLGWAYARRGDLDKAEQYLDEAVRVQATASRLYRRGRVYNALGQAARARADFDRALVYAEDAATAALVRQALQEMDNPIPGQGTNGINR